MNRKTRDSNERTELLMPDIASTHELIFRAEDLSADVINEEEMTAKLTASSEYEAKRWGYTEILMHGKDNVRLDRIAEIGCVLLNHQSDERAASILSVRLVNRKLEFEIKFLSTQRGKDAFIEVKEGALRGVSIGYRVHVWEVNDDDDIYRAIDWEPYEISLTPIPVDPTVGIGRSEDDSKAAFFASINRSEQEKLPMSEDKNAPVQTRDDNHQVSPIVNAPDATGTTDGTRSIDVDAAVDHARQEAKEISKRASSLGLDPVDFIGMSREDANVAMLDAVAKRGEKETKPVITDDLEVTDNADDKKRDYFADALVKTRSIQCLRELARDNGINPFDGRAFAYAVLGRDEMGRRALETTTSLGNVTALAGQKFIVLGFDTYVPWTTPVSDVRLTSDFKGVKSAGLSFGAFNTPGEGGALTDLTADDIGDSGNIAFKGGIVQLTEEAIWNDDLDLWFKGIQRLGYMARYEEDVVLVAALEAASFTAASGVLPFTAANLKTTWAAYNALTNASGKKLGFPAAFIVLPTGLFIDGLETTTNAKGETTARIFGAEGELALQCINGVTLTDANDWYLAANPALANGLTLLKHTAYPNPKMEEIDAGAVIARKWKIKYPLGGMINNLKPNAPMGWYKQIVP